MISRTAAASSRDATSVAKTRDRRRRLTCALVAMTLIGGACSGGDDTAQDEPTTPSTVTVEDAAGDTQTEQTANTAVSAEAGPEWLGSPINEAEARVNEFRRRVASVGVSERLAVAPSDKLVVYVQCPLAECTGALSGLDEAGELLGARIDVITHDGTEDSIRDAWKQAADAAPDAVVGRLARPDWAESAIDTLSSAGVPVVTWAADLPYEPGNGVTANLAGSDSHFFAGILLADYIALAGRDEDKVNVHYIAVDDVPVLGHVGAGFEADLASSCPTCVLSQETVASASLLGGIDGAALAATIQANDIDWVVVPHAGMLTGVADALDAAGVAPELRIASTTGGPETFALMASGRYVVADIGLAAEYLGWRSLDIIGRMLGGQAIGRADQRELAVLGGYPDVMADGMPVRYVESGILDDPDEFWPGVDGFRNKFKELWEI